MKNDPLKIVLTGTPWSGKTSFCHQFLNKTFSHLTRQTPGFEFFQKDNFHLTECDRNVQLNLYDCGGTILFLPLYKTYYKDADVCVLFFDVNDEDPIHGLEYWKRLFLEMNGNELNTPFIVVGTKIDLNERKVSKEIITQWCNSNGNLPYCEISSKENINIDETFNTIIKSALEFSNLKK